MKNNNEEDGNDVEMVKIYELEIPRPEWEELTDKLATLDSSRKYSNKHRAKQAVYLALELLRREAETVNRELNSAEERIEQLRSYTDID